MNNEKNYREFLRQKVKILQIVTVALLLGCTVFLGIAIVLRNNGQFGEDFPEVGVYVMIIFALVQLGAGPVAAALIGNSQIANIGRNPEWQPTPINSPDARAIQELGDPGRLVMAYQTQHIIGSGMLEAGAFFLIITFMMSGNLPALLLCSVLIGALAMRFPTAQRAEHWMENALLKLEAVRRE